MGISGAAGLQSPYPTDMPANAWVLGITYPQSIKRLGHFLTADNISAETPNGGKGISGAADTAWLLGIANSQNIKRLGHFLTADNISAGTPNGGKGISGATEAMLSEQHHYLHVPFLIRPKVTGRMNFRQ